MNVNEAIDALTKLAEEGHGYLELICEDVRSGDTGSICIGDTEEKSSHHTMGHLCDYEDGVKFVPIYMDH